MESSKPWIRIRYRILMENIGERPFYRKEAEEILVSYGKPLSNMNEFFGILEKEGLLKIIKKGGKTMYQIVKKDGGRTTKDNLIRILKTGADIIRVRVDYRILLIILFYKALSDKWKARLEKHKKDVKNLDDAYHLTNIDYYYLYDEDDGKLYTWDEVTRDKINIVKNFVEALNKISEMNEKLSDLRELVIKLGFPGFVHNEDNYHIFVDLIDLFSKVDLSKQEYDVIGDAYEWILSYFAPSRAKEGENYTPREVIRLMVEILDIHPNKYVLDPAAGSGAMLIQAFKYVSEKYKDGKTLRLEGQEINDTTAILAKINLLLHGTENYTIHHGDSLINPRFEKADYVIANPPWNQDGYDESKIMKDDLKHIYKYGPSTKQSADWLWVQLMLNFSNDKVAVILDNGALFRGGKEKRVRKAIIENDLIESIILLPEKLFYNTGASGIILMLNKNKPKERKGKILFINASREFEKHPEVRKLNILSRKNIEKIAKAYRKFRDVEGFCRVVDLDEIKENDYNLNVTLYVFPEEEIEEIDVKKEWEKLRKIEKEVENIERKISLYLKEVYQ